MSVWRGRDNRMMVCRLGSTLGMPLPSGQPQHPRAWLHPLLGNTLKGFHIAQALPVLSEPFGSGLLWLQNQRPPSRQQTVGGAHRALTQCKLCIPFYLQDTDGNFKGFPACGRLLGGKASSRAWLERGHWEGKNPGCGDPPGEKTGLGGSELLAQLFPPPPGGSVATSSNVLACRARSYIRKV